MSNRPSLPPDCGEREKILKDLDRTMLVEAAAGTGKTTSMVGRMVALLAEGKCEIHTLAAITFTKKAAAELRERFQAELAKGAKTGVGESRRRLERAASHVEKAFIGTIHSFCARLVRERPVEAGVDIAFEEMDDEEDRVFSERVWREYVARLHAVDSPILEDLHLLGLRIDRLERAYSHLCQYPDVKEWPAPEVPLPDLGPVTGKLESYARHMRELASRLPDEYGNDKLIPKYKLISRLVRWKDLKDPSQLMDVLSAFGNAKPVLKEWRLDGGEKPDKNLAKSESERWEAFRKEVAEPTLTVWRSHRYPKVFEAVRPAAELCAERRLRAGKLNYQDLLLFASNLLRNHPTVRSYFRKRFTHLLVDEFQDTDPVQAEVMLLLTADDPNERIWNECRPVDGSLFVVGDPKQSIYRFRRADIVTYNEVKRIIQENGGSAVTLSTNFRTVSPLVAWVNRAFEQAFDTGERRYSPQYVPLQAWRGEGAAGELQGVRRLLLCPEGRKHEPVVRKEAEIIARTIRHAIDVGLPMPRTEKERERGTPPHAIASDFMVVTRKKRYLSLYAENLQGYGIPHEVTGGTGGNEAKPLALLRDCLAAALRPDDPVALVAVLRGELFGISDPGLFEFKDAGGKFNYLLPVPREMVTEERGWIEDAFGRLRRYDTWLRALPVMSALERIVEDLGLVALCTLSPRGNLEAGSLLKAIEILRSEGRGRNSLVDVLDTLSRMVEGGEAFDSIPAKVVDEPAVRVMNLHKAKGLEAPVVFLADPTGRSDGHPVDVHVDRSSGNARGYLAVFEEGLFGRQGEPLAHPPDWERWMEEEKRFLEAEESRLLYVAATRAGSQMVVSQIDNAQKSNPWSFFAGFLEEDSSLPVQDQAVAGTVGPVPPGAVQTDWRDEAISPRWERVLQPSYRMEAAKEAALAGERISVGSDDRGTEWGSAIHLLLETAATRPDADLHGSAVNALSGHGLDPALSEEAVALVRSVLASEIWTRASASSKRLVEVPFQKLKKQKGDTEPELPTILRGVIDLVFREPEGWVIVDYKTDRGTEDRLPKLITHYTPQLETYAQAWEEMTGERVHETGLYFTHLERYCPVPFC